MELRAGYKQTVVGLLPNDWTLRSIASFSAFVTKGATPTTYGFGWTSDGVVFLRSECVSGHGLDLRQSMFVSEDAYRALNRGEVRGGDVLITITGNVGRVVLLPTSFGTALVNQHIARVRVSDTRVSREFVFHWLSQTRVREQYTSITTGQAYPQISLRQVRDTIVPLPPLAEQSDIARALSDVDASASALERLVAKNRDVKQATMQRLLTGEQRLPEFVAAWQPYTFDTLFDFLRTASNARSDLGRDGDVGYIHYGDLHKTSATRLICDHATLPTIPRAKVVGVPRVLDGDLVMADASEDYPGVGRAMEVHNPDMHPVVAGLHTILMRPKRNLLAKGFVGYLPLFSAVKNALERAATGISVYGISKASVRAVEVQLPAVDEQRAITAVLSDMDAELAALEQRLTKTRALKQAMMQELLTGRTRLVPAAAE